MAIAPDASKLPPQAPELEQAVLGACIIEPRCIDNLRAFLFPEHFYVKAHEYIYRAIIDVRERGIMPDILSVTDELLKTKRLEQAGGAFYLAQLSSKVASAANAEYHARIIQQEYIRRALIVGCSGTIAEAYDESKDVFDVMETHDNRMADVRRITNAPEPQSMFEVMGQIVDDTSRPLYLHLGYAEVDKHVAIGPGAIVVIGARPAIGKTTFVINALTNMAMAGHKCLFLSLEMNKAQLTAKVASAYTGIDSERITRGDIDQGDRDRIADAMNRNAAWLPRILMEHLPTIHANQVAGIFHRAKERHGCEVVVIDYLQLMEADGEGVERMSNISKAIKRAAIATGIRVIEVSQLKRREGNELRPLMSDLREAGQLEADGDIILMLGREKGDSKLTVFIEKNKMGPTGAEELPFDLMTQRIGGAVQAPSFNPRLPVMSSRPDAFIEPVRDDAPF